MSNDMKDFASLAASIATALAFIVGAVQLWIIRRQNRIESHLIFGQAERQIWLAALQQRDIAPNILAATWNHTPNVESSEELFLAILMDHYEHRFVRQKHGLMEQDVWLPISDYIAHQLSTQPACSIWNAIKKYYSKYFEEYFDSKLEKLSRDAA